MTLRQSNKQIYWAWKAMKQRCQNPRCQAFKNYGGRGIKVCDEWQDFEPFLRWALANGYKNGLDLDRENNDGDYFPDNCRWISRRENVNNRRVTVFIDVGGVCLPDTVWAEKIGVRGSLLRQWIEKHGMRYAEERIADIIEHGYKKHDYGFSHRKAVRHEESGRVFPSVREAAEHFGIAPCTISNAMREGRTTGRGRFLWEELDEQGNVIGGNKQ